ncbi:hypothetical protein [Paraflavitalea pollutisoli]|uniref:hypothetical protein n=1 Tax=Paraflavitalea pollutisoli TaxID=3034143 RepID=UPI0023EB8BC1|nr:hypothetical protein [Paraflavitalea sp. H1-2-19X]
MTRTFTCALLLLIATGTHAQDKTLIGVEVAYSADVFKIADPGARMSKPDVSAALWGVNIRRSIHKYAFFETGVYMRAYKVGLAFDGYYGSQSTDRTAYLLPLRIGARLPLLKSAVAICPVAGFTFGITDEGSLIKSDGIFGWDGVEKIQYKYTVQYPSQVLTLVQVGLGVDIKLWPKTLLHLNTNYYAGISPALRQTIQYQPQNGQVHYDAIQTSKGSFVAAGIGIKYAVNWF